MSCTNLARRVVWIEKLVWAIAGVIALAASEMKAQQADLNSLICSAKGWTYNNRYASVSEQTAYLHGQGPGLLFEYTRDSGDLFPEKAFNNAAYRPTATKTFETLDLSPYNRLSFWIYVEGNAEEAFQWGFTAGAPFRLSCRRGDWFHARWDIAEPGASLKSAAQFVMRGVNQGSPPGDPKRAKIYLSDFKLETTAATAHSGWDPDAGEMILPFSGVYPGETVTALLAPQHARKRFRLSGLGVEEDGFSSDARKTARAAYSEARIVAPSRPGDYTLALEDGPSATLRVQEHPYDEAVGKALRALRAQRCGTATELHAPCHLDDAIREDNGEHVDVSGGWHDEGVAQFPHSTVRITANLARFRGSHTRPYRLGLNPGAEDDLQAELEWGLRSILKYEVAPGLYLHSFANPHWYYTDNKPGTGDDRKVDVCPPSQLNCWWLTEALALCARVCDSPLKEQARAAAERCWELHRKVRELYPPAELERWEGDAKNIRATAAHVAASLEMFRLTGEERYAADAAEQGDHLLTFQETKQEAQGAPVGFFYKNLGLPGIYNGVKDKSLDMPGRALAELLMALPDHPNAPRWREALRLFAEGTLKPLGRFNAPYGYVAAGPFREPETSLFPGEERGGMFLYSLHFSCNKGGKDISSKDTESQFGLATQLAAMGMALEDAEMREMAHGALRYLLGANPFHVSVMRHFGDRFPENAQLPNVPGMMLCRIGMTSEGLPFFNLFGACRYTTPPIFVVKEGTTAQCAYLMDACSYLEKAPR